MILLLSVLFHIAFVQAETLIQFPPDSPFLKRLGRYSIFSDPKLSDYPLKDVGQIIAVETHAVEVANGRAWSELDPKLTRSLQVNLARLTYPNQNSNYLAIGVAYFPPGALSELSKGMEMNVARYGLGNFKKKARIIDLRQIATENGAVIFEMNDGQDWVPGASCEIEIRSVKRKPVQVPSSALIHIETEEYVVRAMGSNIFEPKHVSVLKEDGDWATVDGGLHPGDVIVEEGAILLKPEVQKYLKMGSR